MDGTAAETLDAIARPSGGFAMVAMDQRESLRTMFAAAAGERVGDATMVAFKTAVARALGPLASGFLIDRSYGFDRVRAGVLPAGCGLILAADQLEQEPGQPVEESRIDETVASQQFDLTGVRALKLLLIWRRERGLAQSAVPRLERLIELVDRECTPWWRA